MSRLLSLMRALPARRFSSFRQRISFRQEFRKRGGTGQLLKGREAVYLNELDGGPEAN
jgi:hypothetical protein